MNNTDILTKPGRQHWRPVVLVIALVVCMKVDAQTTPMRTVVWDSHAEHGDTSLDIPVTFLWRNDTGAAVWAPINPSSVFCSVCDADGTPMMSLSGGEMNQCRFPRDFDEIPAGTSVSYDHTFRATDQAVDRIRQASSFQFTVVIGFRNGDGIPLADQADEYESEHMPVPK